MNFKPGDVLAAAVVEAVNREAIVLAHPKRLDHDVGPPEEPRKSSVAPPSSSVLLDPSPQEAARVAKTLEAAIHEIRNGKF